ncbi:trypsin-like serine protease [Streptomyces sp. NPDC017405]|uniref:trypsin-like serine protease n=1 Tax=unclassified Streptomyces TaxID=2593676 RepID=UPI0037B1587F
MRLSRMRASAVAGATAVLALAGGLVPTSAHAILGGVEAGKLRGAVQVNGSLGYTCSGILVAEDWVLTAKHCLAGETDQTMSVYVGDRPLGQGTYRRLQGFTRWSLGDAALLQLDKEIPNAAFMMAPR